MTKSIRFEGKIYKLPDDVTDEEINNIISNNSSESSQQGFKGIGNDIYKTFSEPLSHPISSALKTLASGASETYGLGKQAFSLPFEALSGHIPRITRNISQGFENFVNTPATIAGYLSKKGFFPKDVKENSWIHINPLRKPEGEELGDAFAQGIPAAALLGPLGEAGSASGIFRALQRSGTGAAFGASQNQNPITSGILSGAVPSITSSAGKGLKSTLLKAKNKINEPFENLKLQENLIQNIKNSLEKNKSNIEKAKEDAANYTNEELKKSLDEESKSKENIKSLIPNIPKSKANKYLSDSILNEENYLTDNISKKYKEFSSSPAGIAKIKDHFHISDINKQLKGLKDIPNTLKKMASKISSKTEIPKDSDIILLSPSLRNFKENILPPKKNTVNDYIEFLKEARDASYQAYEKAETDKTLTNGEKSEYRKSGKKLNELKEKTEEKIKKAIPDDYHILQGINEEWKKYVLPFKRSQSGGVFNKASRGDITDNFFSVLHKPKNEPIKDYLTNKDAVRKALLQSQISGYKHPLSKTTLKSQASHISNLENTENDIYKLLDKKQIEGLNNHKNISVKRKNIEQLMSKINSPQFDEILNSFERNRLKKYSSEAENKIGKIEKFNKENSNLQNKLTNLLEDFKEKKTDAEKRKTQLKILKIISKILAIKSGAKYIDRLLF